MFFWEASSSGKAAPVSWSIPTPSSTASPSPHGVWEANLALSSGGEQWLIPKPTSISLHPLIPGIG